MVLHHWILGNKTAVTFTDGYQTPVQGDNSEHVAHNSFEFQAGERIRDMWVGASSDQVAFIGSLSIETNRGRSWKAGPKDETVSWNVRVHSGFFLGISCGIDQMSFSGKQIGKLSLYFL